MKLLKWLLVLLPGVIVVLGLAFIVAGILIPSETLVVQNTEINASTDTVWGVLTDRESYPEWQEKITKVEIKDDNKWTEISKDAGPIEFEFVRVDKPRLIELRYSTVSGVGGEWRGEVKSAGEAKTTVTTTDKTVVNSWVAKVFMAMFFDLEEFAKDWNKSLKARCEAIEKKQPDSKSG